MPDPSFAFRKPYERWPEESAQAFAAFTFYLNMAATERNMLAAYRQARNRPTAQGISGTWAMWFRKYHWAERVQAWDAELAKVERDAQIRAAIRRAQQWADRRLELIEQEWNDSQRMRTRGLEMMDFSLTAVTNTREELTEQGMRVVQEVQPVGWRMRDAALFLTKASDIGRRAANMATEIVNTAPVMPDLEADPLSKAQQVARDMVERFPQYSLDQILMIASQVSGYTAEVLRLGIPEPKAQPETQDSLDAPCSELAETTPQAE